MKSARLLASVLLSLLSLFALSCAPREVSNALDNSSETLESASSEAPSRFRAGFVGFADSDVAEWREALRDSNFELASFSREEFLDAPLEDFDFVAIRVIGWTPTEEERERARRLVATTNCYGHTQTLDFGREATSVSPELTEKLSGYFGFPVAENARRLAATVMDALGKTPDFKTLRIVSEGSETIVAPDEPISTPEPGFFRLGSEISGSYEEFAARLDREGKPIVEGAPRVALFGDFLDPFKEMDRKPVDQLIAKLEGRGFNVFPIFKVQNKRELLSDCRPDLAIYFPRGRVFPDGKAPELFAALDIPVLTAVLLSTTEREFRTEPIGATGSYFSLATALPELDGAIEPLAIATKDADESGLVTRRALDERIDALVERCQGWLDLRRKPNSDKKLAIFYYKAPGARALSAQSLEVVDSIFNVLTRAKEEGYDLGSEFPATKEELEALIDKRGKTIGSWELGTFARFVEEADPAFLSETKYRELFRAKLSREARDQIEDAWGAAPGDYMVADSGDEFGIVVPRLEFGNVALIPQPTTDVVKGDPYSKQGDDFDAVHGTGKAPPHFYVAAYLWAREKFGADAIVHFGTHGSLEFAKGKTAFPTESCFPDALIGNKPSVYIYSINNVGEALLAKRRIRSVLISHLTPPFMRGGLDGAARELDDKIHEYETCEEPLLKSELGVSLAELAISSGVVDDLIENPAFQQFADPARKSEFLTNKETFSEERLDALHALLHRYENARATNGLHVLGRPWTDEQVAETSDLSELPNDEAAERLRASFQLELDRFFAALSGRFVPPSPGGDFLHTPDAAPTGRNLTGLDVQRLPTPEAERVGAKLVDELLQTYRDRNDGAWPRKVANTLWGGESIRTQGVGIAQVLYLMGVRVKRDGRGAASDVELIPSSELGRPRIDVLVQTSGQFRDSFGSRIELVDRAVALAAEAPEAEPFPNFVRENARKIEERLVAESRLAEPEARDLATARVFGATNALSYGTGIMNLVERGDAWEKDEDVANRYLANMSGVYRDANRWGAPFEGLLEYNLDGLDLSTQTRSSNSWGPAKLDHVYEFATLATAARVKTGRAPEIWFHDLRDASKPRVESARAALREELRSTLWNSKYLSGLQREGASAAASVSETTRNLFGWSVARPDLIDDSIWEETKAVLVDDVKGLGIREWFEDKNPGALQDATAVMLLAIRKGRWSASEETKAQIARLHAELVQKFGASGSYETSGDSEARKFIADLLEPDLKSAYQEAIDFATTPPPTPVDGLSLTEATDEPERDAAPSLEEKRFPVLGLALALIAILCFLSGFLKSKKKSRGA